MRNKPGHVSLYIAAHGAYETSVRDFDTLMTEYSATPLPKLKQQLQRYSDEQHGGGIDYSDLTTVTECLFIWAELLGLATN